MIKLTLKIDGMKCGMCEAHVNDSIRKACPKVIKVASSASKGESKMILEGEDKIEEIINAIQSQGYKVLSQEKEEYVKKGLFYKL